MSIVGRRSAIKSNIYSPQPEAKKDRLKGLKTYRNPKAEIAASLVVVVFIPEHPIGPLKEGPKLIIQCLRERAFRCCQYLIIYRNESKLAFVLLVLFLDAFSSPFFTPEKASLVLENEYWLSVFRLGVPFVTLRVRGAHESTRPKQPEALTSKF